MQVAERTRRHSQRGQAMIETAIFLPLFLIILFGVIWIVQAGVVNERLQLAVRYSGLVSSQASPFSAWSLYSLYENSEYPGTTAATRICIAPSVGVLSNTAPFPGPTSAPFWQPYSTGQPACESGYIVMTGSGFVEPAVFNNSISSLDAQTQVPTYLTAGGNPLPQLQQLSATQIFFTPPDMATMLICYGDVDSAVQASLEGQGGSTTTAAAQLPLYPASESVNLTCSANN